MKKIILTIIFFLASSSALAHGGITCGTETGKGGSGNQESNGSANE